MQWLQLILALSILVVIHELGHFCFARIFKVRVEKFYMFFNPKFSLVRAKKINGKWQVKFFAPNVEPAAVPILDAMGNEKKDEKGNTLYRPMTEEEMAALPEDDWRHYPDNTEWGLGWVPFGGYCAMEGEDEDTDNPRSFQKAAWWKRLIILVAGSFMNFVTGVVLIALVLSFSKGYTDTKLVSLEPSSSMAVADGLKAGDRILSLNGTKVDIYSDLALEMHFLQDGQYDVTVERDGQKLKLQDVPFARKDFGDGNGLRFGMSFGAEKTTFQSVLQQIWPETRYQIKSVFLSLKMLFTGQAGVQDMAGPVGIVQIMSETVDSAEGIYAQILTSLSFGAMIAINLALMNMLPIPALDGGRVLGLLLTCAIEKITRKKLDAKYEGYIHGIGMVLLLALMAVILFKDIFVIFKR